MQASDVFFYSGSLLAHVAPSELPSNEDTEAVSYGQNADNFKPLGK